VPDQPALYCGAKHIANNEGSDSNTYQQKHHEILEHSSLQVSAICWLENGRSLRGLCQEQAAMKASHT
jgi:hypothetical protein